MICGGNEAVTGHGDAEGVRTERLYSMEAWQCVDRLTQWNCWHRRPLSDLITQQLMRHQSKWWWW